MVYIQSTANGQEINNTNLSKKGIQAAIALLEDYSYNNERDIIMTPSDFERLITEYRNVEELLSNDEEEESLMEELKSGSMDLYDVLGELSNRDRTRDFEYIDGCILAVNFRELPWK